MRLVVAGLMIAVLVLVVIFMVWRPLVTAFQGMRSAATKRSVFALPDGPEPAHMRGAPLPSSASAPSEKDFRVQYIAWLNRTIMAHYPVDKDPKGAAYMRESLDFLGENSEMNPPKEMVTEEETFNLNSVNDPALLMMIGIAEPVSQRQRDALDKATALMPASAYPKFIWFFAASCADRAQSLANAGYDDLKVRDALCLKYLQLGLNDRSFLPSEMSALRWRFNGNSMKGLLFRRGPEVAEIFEASPDVMPWMKDYVQGVRYTDAAWAARGTAVATNVSQQSWADFGRYLGMARTCLVNSWRINPHDPAAATEMIKVCMGENEDTDTMRKWFDRAVAADFDFRAAYSQFEWGLRPRWMGSYAEMNAFGEECSATGRYDTCVPFQRVQIALDISEDAADRGMQFRDARISGEVLGVIDHYFEEPNPPIPIAFAHTAAAIVAHKVGRTDEVKRHLAAIDYRPLNTALFARMVDLRALALEAQGQ